MLGALQAGMAAFSRQAGYVNPVSVPGCTLWLRADLGVTGTSPVTAWADQSGLGNNAAVGGVGAVLNPSSINALPALTWPGGGAAWMDGNGQLDGGNAYTVFAVLRAASSAAGQLMELRANANSHGFSQYLLTTYVNFQTDPGTDIAATGLSDPTGVPQILRYKWTGPHAAPSLKVNGVEISISPSSTLDTLTGAAGFRIGNRRNTGAAQGYDGDTSEFIVYNSAISDDDEALVMADLATRYAITL